MGDDDGVSGNDEVGSDDEVGCVFEVGDDDEVVMKMRWWR